MNHTKLNFKTRFLCALKGLKLEPCKATLIENNELDDYYEIAKKHQHGQGLIFKDGRVIVPYNENFKIMDYSRDTVLIYNGVSKTIDAISLTSGKVIYSTLAYSNLSQDARFVNQYYLCDNGEYELNTTYSIIKDATKRYRITVYDGKELASGILDLKIFDTPYGKPLYLILRYEDHFGILDNTGKITKCEFINKFDKQVYSLPASFGNWNEKGELDHYFLDMSGFVKTGSPYKDIELCEDRVFYCGPSNNVNIYKVKTLNDRYAFINDSGEMIIHKTFCSVYPFVSNRAIVKENKDDYYYVIDENGREIKKHNIFIKGVDRNYEKIRYNEFDMTLALIYDDASQSLLYVDKELNKYFYTPEH